ncbi:hypothetical protein CR513_56136, partial [Mucuna pruriens]
MEFKITSRGMILRKRKYILKVLKMFHMSNCNSTTTPMEYRIKLIGDHCENLLDNTLYKQIVGSLRYICNSRPDIAYFVGLISKFMNDPKSSHLLVAKRILRHLKGTIDHGLLHEEYNKILSLLKELQVKMESSIQSLFDNKSAINLTKNLMAHGRSKHIETRFHYLRDKVNKEKLEIIYCKTT